MDNVYLYIFTNILLKIIREEKNKKIKKSYKINQNNLSKYILIH